MADRLELRGELAELRRLAPWVEALSAQHGFGGKTAFAMNLCLEEALSNIMRHGYKGDAAKSIWVEFRSIETDWLFIIEDEAPHFQPVNMGIPAPQSLEEMVPGGLGIPLMRQFADVVEWEPLASGNRLTLKFKREP